MERRRFRRLRTGQSYEMMGLIYFLTACYAWMPQRIQQAVVDSCQAAAGRSGNADALFLYMTQGKSKTEIMMKFYIASETSIDRMVRDFFLEMEKRLKEMKNAR